MCEFVKYKIEKVYLFIYRIIYSIFNDFEVLLLYKINFRDIFNVVDFFRFLSHREVFKIV